MATRQEKLARSQPVYMEEPVGLQEYARILDRVADDCRPVIVRRRGTDIAAVISLEHLQLLEDALAHRAAEELAAQIHWSRVASEEPPTQWLERDEPKPF